MARAQPYIPGVSASGGGGGTGELFADILTDAANPLDALRIYSNDWETNTDFVVQRRNPHVQASLAIGTINGTINVTALASWMMGAAGNGNPLGLRNRGTRVAAVAAVQATARLGLPGNAAAGLELRVQAAGAAGNALSARVRTEPRPVTARAATGDHGNMRVTANVAGAAANGLIFMLNRTANNNRSVEWDDGLARTTALAAMANSGAVQIEVNSVVNFFIGNTIVIGGSTLNDTRVITGINRTANTITFAGGLTNSYATNGTVAKQAGSRRIIYNIPTTRTWGNIRDDYPGETKPAGTPAVTVTVIDENTHSQQATDGSATLGGGVDAVVGTLEGVSFDAGNTRIEIVQNPDTTFAFLTNALNGFVAGAHTISAAAFGATGGATILATGTTPFTGGANRIPPVWAPDRELVPPQAEVLVWAVGADEEVGFRAQIVEGVLAGADGTAGNAWTFVVDQDTTQPLGTPLVGHSTALRRIRVAFHPQESLANIASAMENWNVGGLRILRIGTYQGTHRVATQTHSFSGGEDDIIVKVRFNSGDTIQQITALLNGDARWAAVLNTGATTAATIASLIAGNGTDVEFIDGTDAEPVTYDYDATSTPTRAVVGYNETLDTMGDIVSFLMNDPDVDGIRFEYRGLALASSRPQAPPYTRDVGPVNVSGPGTSTGTVDQAARDAASTALATAQTAETTADAATTPAEAAAQARAVTADWAEQGNTDAIPADKLTNAPSGGGTVATDATITGDGQNTPLAVANPFTDDDETKLDGVAERSNRVIPYKIGNVYIAQASTTPPTKPADGTGNGNAASGVVTSGGITTPPQGWQLTRPEATEALPNVFDMHVYGYDINGVFQWQFGTPNRTDRFITGGTGGGFTLRSGAGAPANSLGDDDDWYLNTTNGAWSEKKSGAWGSPVYTDMVGAAGTMDGVLNALAIAASGVLTAGLSIGADVTVDLSTALALLTGATFTGHVSGIAPTADAHLATKAYVDSVASGGTAQMHDLWAAWSDDATFTATEIMAGESSDSGNVTIPTGTGTQFLGFWRSDTDGGDPTEVHIAGGGNIRNTFGAATDLTVDGEAGKLIVSATTQNRALLGGETARIV